MGPRLKMAAHAIETPLMFLRNEQYGPGWQLRYTDPEKIGMTVLQNSQSKKALINFRGISGKDPAHMKANVFNHIIRGKDTVVQNSKNFRETDAVLEHIIPSLQKEGYTIQMNGHSYGGYKARYFGAKYNQPAELLNAHIFPWNKFPRAKKTANFHTIVSDPTNFKHIYANVPKNENHFVYPETQIPKTKKLLSGHYVSAFTGKERTFSNLQKYLNNVGYLNTALGAAAVGGGIADMIHKKNPTDRISQGLTGNLTETGMLGYNIDPDYQWSDEHPPNFGIDWALYHATKGLTELAGLHKNPSPKPQLLSSTNLAKN